MKRIQLKDMMFHPNRGHFDFVMVQESDYHDKGEYVEVTSAVSSITYEIPKDNIAYVAEERADGNLAL